MGGMAARPTERRVEGRVQRDEGEGGDDRGLEAVDLTQSTRYSVSRATTTYHCASKPSISWTSDVSRISWRHIRAPTEHTFSKPSRMRQLNARDRVSLSGQGTLSHLARCQSR